MLNTTELETSVEPIIKRGLSFHEAGNNLAAAKTFEVAYRRDPSALVAALNMGSAYYKAKFYPEAEEAYLEVLRNDPDNTAAYYGIAMVSEEIGDRPRAQTYFQKAAELNPTSAKLWLSLAEVSYEETTRMQALNRAVDAAKAQLQAADLTYDTALQSGGVLLAAGLYAEALPAYKAALHHNPASIKALMKLATCYHRLTKYRAAGDAMRELIMRCTPEYRTKKYSTAFVKTAQKALVEIHNTLNEGDVQFFLVAGTLLGCVRNKAPLAHDRDVDIAIMDSTPNKTIVEALRANPQFSCPLTYSEDDMYLSITHNGIAIDIFRHELQQGYLWCGASRNPGDIKWRYTPFSLNQQTFFNLPFYTPSDTDKYLRENYGDWETTDTAFSSALSSPARFDVHPDVVRLLAYLRLWYSVSKQNTDSIRRLIDQAPEELNKDNELKQRALELST